MTEREKMEKAILNLLALGPVGPYEMDLKLELAGIRSGSSEFKVLRIDMIERGVIKFDPKRRLSLP